MPDNGSRLGILTLDGIWVYDDGLKNQNKIRKSSERSKK